MSFGFSIGDFLAVLELAQKVRKDFVGAPEQFKEVSSEVRSLSIVLNDVDICLSECELSDQQETQLREVAAGCRKVLESLERTLAKYVDLDVTDGSLKRRAKRVWKRVQWEPDEIRDLRVRVIEHLVLLNAFLGGVSSQLVSSTKKGVDSLNRHRADQERVAIHDWLAPLEYGLQQQTIYSSHHPGTGQWLLDSDQYQTWLSTRGQTLFCPGIPGAGKTTLTAIVIEDLKRRYAQIPDVGIAYIYCDFRRRDDQTPVKFLANVLKQLSRQRDALPEHLEELWQQHKSNRTQPSLDDVSNTLRRTVPLFSRVIIVVDALDECQTLDGCRAKFLAEILRLQRGSGVNLFATSRFIPEIVSSFEDSDSVTFEISASREDVERYVEGNMTLLAPFVQRNTKLQADIKDAISGAADGMFLLAYVYLHSLEDKTTPKAVRNALQQFQGGQGHGQASEASKVQILSQAYDQAMDRINRQSAGLKELATRVLAWITCAKWPLTVLKLQHALAVELDEPEMDEENLVDAETMVSVCSGLVTVDDESTIIRLVHYTTQEYLERTQATWFPDAEADITSVCMAYLSFVKDWRSTPSLPFYDYALVNWCLHVPKAPGISQQIADFLMHCGAWVLWETLDGLNSVDVKRYLWERARSSSPPKDVHITGTHWAAFNGWDSILRILLERTGDPDAQDGHGNTPLMWAAGKGRETTVELLLATEGVNAGHRNPHGDTALSEAAASGKEGVVKLLLAKESVDPDTVDIFDRTPLWRAMMSSPWRATESESDATAAALLATGQVDVNFRDSDQNQDTPLCWAVRNRRGRLVELLLAAGADPNMEARWDWTPLSLASSSGNLASVEHLIATGEVDVDAARGYHEWTPLMHAARNGCVKVAKLLLATGGVQAGRKCRAGRTALSWAAESGHANVVEVLLDAEGVDPNDADDEGKTPLAWAVENDHDAVAELLRMHGAVEEDRRDLPTRTKVRSDSM